MRLAAAAPAAQLIFELRATRISSLIARSTGHAFGRASGVFCLMPAFDTHLVEIHLCRRAERHTFIPRDYAVGVMKKRACTDEIAATGILCVAHEHRSNFK
jgi:hypothetical protein